MSGKTLKGLNAQVGDVFTSAGGADWKILSTTPKNQILENVSDGRRINYSHHFDLSTHWVLKSRAPVIKYGEWQVGLQVTAPADADIKPLGDGWVAYRLPIKPVVVEKELWLGSTSVAKGGLDVFINPRYCSPVAKITFNIVDGVPDCDSVRMTKL